MKHNFHIAIQFTLVNIIENLKRCQITSRQYIGTFGKKKEQRAMRTKTQIQTNLKRHCQSEDHRASSQTSTN